MDGGNGGGRFKVELESDASEVTDVHKAGTGEVGDVVRERETGVKSNTKTANRGIRRENKGRGASGKVN